jgi:ribosome-binding protein aMBF1 (putative translation factor)
MTRTRSQTKDALKILGKLTGESEAVRVGIAGAKVNFAVAQMIYDARTRAGLSQSALAALIGTKQPVIARLEDADYEGHSLTMLQRIAGALEQRLELRFVPASDAAKRRPPPGASRGRKLQPA